MQAKWWMKRYVSYRSLEALPNEPLERVGGEPPPRQKPKCARRSPLQIHHASGPFELRLDLRERLVRGFLGEPLLDQAPPDRLVAVATARESPGPRRSGSAIVHEPDTLEGADRATPLRGCDAPPLERRLEPSRAQIAVAQGLCSRIDRVDAAKLVAKPPKKGPVQLEPLAKAAADDHFRRQPPPGRAVELDLDLPCAGLPESGDSGYAVTSSASSGTGSGIAAPFSAATEGSRRAETT
jgi:hypothetical protein